MIGQGVDLAAIAREQAQQEQMMRDALHHAMHNPLKVTTLNMASVGVLEHRDTPESAPHKVLCLAEPNGHRTDLRLTPDVVKQLMRGLMTGGIVPLEEDDEKAA